MADRRAMARGTPMVTPTRAAVMPTEDWETQMGVDVLVTA